MRIEITNKVQFPDGRSKKVLSELQHDFPDQISKIVTIDIYVIDGLKQFTPELASSVFVDPVVQEMKIDESFHKTDQYRGWKIVIEITYKAGVTDPEANTAREAILAVLGKSCDESVLVQTGRQYLIYSESSIDKSAISKLLYNPLIQYAYTFSQVDSVKIPEVYPHRIPESEKTVEQFSIRSMEDRDLMELSKSRVLALNLAEMNAIKSYMQDEKTVSRRRKKNLSSEITDVELEMIAQTWSEHCKHKIFQAEIEYKDGKEEVIIPSVFKTYIRGVTDVVSQKKKYLRSVFHDNSGVIDFDNDNCVCIKAETHNSPSALDPYGGAITGIVGVNRDIIGTGRGARPIFNTNVLCFGNPFLEKDVLPPSHIHPKRIMEGVHRGIVDGGNQSGIPVVAGAFLFDDSFTGKPLVFCGTGGIMPKKIGKKASWEKWIKPGYFAVMTGGSIGKDGIHGATFSSLELNESSPLSAVQIGDPITQKKMLDFLIEARDKQLFDSITDNGAGGLSSSLGEMAEQSGGIEIELHRCPLKYKGLAPWEILVSESQERMSVAVKPEKINDFLALAKKRGVMAAVVGRFTDSGYVEVIYEEDTVAYISLEFLHNGLPKMKLKATWTRPVDSMVYYGDEISEYGNEKELLLKILSDPNVASKEFLVRQYDHEVIGQSVIKPFTGIFTDGPSDGAVIRPVYESYRGLTITHGICPRYGDYDTYHMAMCAVDEAYRAHIACGGDPDYVSALDNFCWPDPITTEENPDGEYKLSQLVRAARGLYEICTSYGIPLISGKDSMKNDSKIDGKKISVRPTLLITLLGIIQDIKKAVSTDFKNTGDLIYCVGKTKRELGGSMLEKIIGKKLGPSPLPEPAKAQFIYRNLFSCIDIGMVKSCHDCSDGGIAVAITESCLGGRHGATIHTDRILHDARTELNLSELLFSETPSRFIITIAPCDKKRFEEIMKNSCSFIGEVTDDPGIHFKKNGIVEFFTTLEEIEKAWFSFEREIQ